MDFITTTSMAMFINWKSGRLSSKEELDRGAPFLFIFVAILISCLRRRILEWIKDQQ